jgi:hypothetical protein
MDLLRPELLSFAEEDVRGIRERFGKFVMINTTFSMVNGFFDTFNVFKKPASPGMSAELGAAGIGTTPEFAAGYAAHKQALFGAFKGILPVLSEAFPEQMFVLRPHPGENREPWNSVARSLPNVRVVHEGNVVPWLLACQVLIHNGCTTAVEAAVIDTPSIVFRPRKAHPFDFDLPNGLSHEVTNVDELCETLRSLLRGELACAAPTRAPRPLNEYLTALDGPLASERIVDALEQSDAGGGGLPRPPLGDYLRGYYAATQRSFVKRFIKARISGHRNNPAFQRHRFQGVSIDELRSRIARLGRALGRFSRVKAEPVAEHIFRISV